MVHEGATGYSRGNIWNRLAKVVNLKLVGWIGCFSQLIVLFSALIILNLELYWVIYQDYLGTLPVNHVSCQFID